jgi:3-oxoacyl-[acyl-carrier protein] reductase
MRLKDKVCVITGAGQGIGWATAQRFFEEGAIVIAMDRHSATLNERVALAKAEGITVTPYAVDVTQREKVEAAMNAIIAQHGRIDVLVNNAGITADAQLRKMSEEQFDRVINVNVKGVFNCTQAVAEHMLAAGKGVILCASSVSGIFGNFGQTNYAASKFAVIGMVKTWARELGPKGIRVNAVAPGFIETPMIETIPEQMMQQLEARVWMRRKGQASEVAAVYAFLASDDASYVNGVVLEVTGGLTV